MNTLMITPVMMAGMMPDNYLPRKDQRKKNTRPAKKCDRKDAFGTSAAQYEPTDPETALRDFYTTYGR
ncbi:MAG: hypothetical protein K5696_03765 [Lachnospiraceae bacterium]|nr:hypothetical protein [Lachnospiraceae bacterium]